MIREGAQALSDLLAESDERVVQEMPSVVRTRQSVQNLARLFDLVERHPLVAGVGAGDVAGAEDHGWDAGAGDSGSIGAVRNGHDAVSSPDGIDGLAEPGHEVA